MTVMNAVLCIVKCDLLIMLSKLFVKYKHNFNVLVLQVSSSGGKGKW